MATRAEVAARYETGETVRGIARQFGVHRHTVSRLLEQSGVPRRYNLLSPDQVAGAARLYNEGWSLARLGDHFNVDHSTIHRAFRKAGVPTRPRTH